MSEREEATAVDDSADRKFMAGDMWTPEEVARMTQLRDAASRYEELKTRLLQPLWLGLDLAHYVAPKVIVPDPPGGFWSMFADALKDAGAIEAPPEPAKFYGPIADDVKAINKRRRQIFGHDL